jgi:hypothetical protein
MERLPNELTDRIFEYCVGHFSELIYQGAVCRLWKKIADESLLWFTLKLKYKAPRDYVDVLEMKFLHCGTRNPEIGRIIRKLYALTCAVVPKKLTWNPNSEHPPPSEPPSSLPLDHLHFAFEVNTTTIVPQNHKTARELRKWFISYVIYHKKCWKWYCYWVPIFCPPTKTQRIICLLGIVAYICVFLPSILFLVSYVFDIEICQF